MSRELLTDGQLSFKGGLNSAAADLNISPDECRVLENCIIDAFGSAEKRQGTKRISTAAISGATTILGGYGWNRAGASNLQVVSSNTDLFYTAFSAYPATWTTVAGTMSSSVRPSMKPFRDNASNEVLFIADGGPLNFFSGTALTENIAGTPNATVLEVYNQRLFGITGSDQTLYYSKLNDGTTLGSAAGGGGSAVVRTFSDQKLTGLAVLGDALLLFHVSGISLFRGYTQDDINIAAGAAGVTSDVGTTSPQSIISLENQVLFYSKRGIYSLSQSGQIRLISQKINDQIADGSLTDTQIANIYARHHKGRREVWFYIPSKGVFVYKYEFDAWSGPFTGGYLSPNATTCIWEWEDANGVPGVMLGNNAAWVQACDVDGEYTDDVTSAGVAGAAYTAIVKTRRIYFDQPAFEKSFRWGALYAQLTADATVEWFTPAGNYSHTPEGTASWGYGVWGMGVWGGSEMEVFHIPLAGRGTYIQYQISDSYDGAFKIVRIDANAFNMNRRAFV